MKLKNNFLLASIIGVSTIASAQQGPTGFGVNGNGVNASTFWARGGNQPNGAGNNIFGTMWNSPVYHYTTGLRRMTLWDNTFGTESTPFGGGLAIHHNPSNPLTAPSSLLTIGENTNIGGQNGRRPWMNVGTTLIKTTDFAYFGLKSESNGNEHAVISWGDDSNDYLRFIFNSYGVGGPNSNSNNGMEVARFSPDGKNGIGNFYQYGVNTNPVRRLEILDANPDNGTNNNAPQLRLTYSYNSSPLLGIFSEFQTTSNGDLYFNTRSAIGAFNGKSFGFHKSNPLNTVEISAQNISLYNPAGATGSSGLRFTSLTSAKNVTPNTTNGINSTKVLTVDQNGDVVLINSGLGALCSSQSDISATAFTASRAIDLNTFNFEWRNGRVGFGTIGCTPGNRVEITGLAPTQSGLRFTNITSANTTIVNPGTGVLSVDANGDVIYVPGGGSNIIGDNGINVTSTGISQLGVPCNSTLPAKFNNGLTTDRVLHMRGNNFVFGDGGRVGIGLSMGGVNMSCGVGNKLEIVNTPGNPYYGPGPEGSGLRFRHLTSLKATIPNGTNGVNSAKVLTVDQNGDVVLTDATIIPNANNGLSVNGNNVQFGLNCIATSTEITDGELKNNRQVVTNGYNVMFNGKGNVGIGLPNNSCSPGSKLEIDNAVANTSGLRFTQLTAISPTTVGNGKVLTVGPNGDVILVPDVGGFNFGAPCNVPVSNSNLITDWRVGMNNNSINFEGTGNFNFGDIGGCVPGSTSPARLWVRNSFGSPNPTTGLRVDNVGGANSYAGYFDNGNLFCTGTGIFSNGAFTISDKNIKTAVNTIKNSMDIINKLRPVSFKYDNTYAPQLTYDNSLNYGFIAQEVGNVVPELARNFDVYSRIDSTGNTIGSTVSLNALNYTALIPFAIGGIQELSIKQKEMQASLDKIGLSDALVKTNINNFNALAKVKTLNPVSYNFTNINVPQLTFKTNLEYGFIAQQLQTVYPELVDTARVDATFDSLGVVVNPSKVLKTVNYKAMTALLARSIQEQQLVIDSLRTSVSKQDSINQAVQQQLANLTNLINSCCSNTSTRNTNTNINQLDIELSDKDAIVLNQNVPNPFAEQTTITYNVPVSVGKAQLIFYNNAGQIIQTVDIKTRGKGKVNVFANDLSSGLYNYTLVADGKVVNSKKMVRE